MEDLKKVFISLGFEHVKTLLASGNVLFASEEMNLDNLTQMIEEKLKEQFGFSIDTIIWPIEKINQLIEANPFAEIHVAPGMRLFVTFIGETSEKPKGTLKIPFSSGGGDLKILSIVNNAICSVLAPTQKTPDLMSVLEKEYGKKVTTRNWNTVLRINEEK
jgi:uncharacterized protein (DUF1697 family)